MEKWIFIAFAIPMLLFSSLDIIPNWSNDVSDYRREENVLTGTHIEVIKYTRKFRERTYETLYLYMQDGSTWEIDKNYSDFWSKLQQTGNIGKKIILYRKNNVIDNLNPVQIEVGGHIIYDINENSTHKYVILLLAIGLIIFSVYHIFRAIVKYYIK